MSGYVRQGFPTSDPQANIVFFYISLLTEKFNTANLCFVNCMEYETFDVSPEDVPSQKLSLTLSVKCEYFILQVNSTVRY
jgi:hypothetical protein